MKNKVAPPFTEVEFDIMYDEGISKLGSLLDLGLEHQVLEKKGAWNAYEGALVGQGRDAAKAALKEKPRARRGRNREGHPGKGQRDRRRPSSPVAAG